MPTRNASATWEGRLRDGKGQFSAESGMVGGAYSFPSRFEEAGGTNPEELLAAAEAACFSMALSGALEAAGTPTTKIETKAACTIEKVGAGFKITKMHLVVTGTGEGLTADAFRQAAEKTKSTCPVSVALANNVEITVETTLG